MVLVNVIQNNSLRPLIEFRVKLLLFINTDNMNRLIYDKVKKLILKLPHPEWKELKYYISS